MIADQDTSKFMTRDRRGQAREAEGEVPSAQLQWWRTNRSARDINGKRASRSDAHAEILANQIGRSDLKTIDAPRIYLSHARAVRDVRGAMVMLAIARVIYGAGTKSRRPGCSIYVGRDGRAEPSIRKYRRRDGSRVRRNMREFFRARRAQSNSRARGRDGEISDSIGL